MDVLNNFLPQEYQDYLAFHFMQPHMIWNYYTDTVDYNIGNADLKKSGVIINDFTKDSHQLVHTFIDKGRQVSDKVSLLDPIFFFLKKHYGISGNKFYRVKLNMMFQDTSYDQSKFYNPPHTDVPLSYPNNYKIFLYYPIDSDGDTIIFNERETADNLTINSRQTPTKGTAIIFDAKQLHCSTPPVTHKHRLALNIVYHA